MKGIQVLNLQLKQAKTAFAEGRLDEACQLAAIPIVREHRGGQQLISHLVTALLKRGQEHLDNARFDEAGRDCRAADRLAGNTPEIAALRETLNNALRANAVRIQQREQVIRAAKQEIGRGALSLGGRMLEQLDGDSRADAVARELKLRRESADAAIARAEEAIKTSAFDAAVRELVDLKRNHPNHAKFETLLSQFSEGAGKQLQGHFDSGRLDLAKMLLHRAEDLICCSCHLSEAAAVMDQFAAASDAQQNGRYRDAANTLTRLATILPKAKWIAAAVKEARSAADAAESLNAGPLGMLDGFAATQVGNAKPQKAPSIEPVARPVAGIDTLTNNDRSLLAVEGVGSFLVMRKAAVKIASASSKRPFDVGLVNAGTLPGLTIERIQDDYFLRSEDSVLVNDRSTKEKLLTNGDRIALNRRCSLKFVLPNPASTTAVLELTSAKLKRPDVRRIILCDDSIVMDQSRSAHVPLHEADPPVIIVARGSQLHAKPMGRGITADQMQDIIAGESVTVGITSFKLSPVERSAC
ncbi:hypothetical protein OAH18_00770 [bacterium]|nr:hypothetical protein [bacterium]